MLTKNFFNWLFCGMAGTSFPTTFSFTDYNGTVNNTKVKSVDYLLEFLFKTYVYGTLDTVTAFGSYKSGFAYGDGSTPETMEDYTLSGTLLTTIETKGNTVVPKIGTDNSYTQQLIVYNSGTEEVTIREVGRFATPNTGLSSSMYTSVLIERCVLDSPLTLGAGEQGIITLELNMPITV